MILFGLTYVKASSFHAYDLASCNGGGSLNNNDCDGTSFTDRIVKYCPRAGYDDFVVCYAYLQI